MEDAIIADIYFTSAVPRKSSGSHRAVMHAGIIAPPRMNKMSARQLIRPDSAEVAYAHQEAMRFAHEEPSIRFRRQFQRARRRRPPARQSFDFHFTIRLSDIRTNE